ncbi:hypothetical protein [Streptomyces sp. NPDC046909]|uniref:hypothetical protein n=1 Tax=Streptomyces sp. NPDC046909 TaxID=3155617 RepID=UPI00340458D2
MIAALQETTYGHRSLRLLARAALCLLGVAADGKLLLDLAGRPHQFEGLAAQLAGAFLAAASRVGAAAGG